MASFHYRIANGGVSTSDYMLHEPGGWRDSTERPARSWAEMVDLDARNAAIQQRTPGSTARFTDIEVRIHVTPPQDHAGDRARLVKLQHAVYTAAEHFGIPTEDVSHIDLVQAIARKAGEPS